jgi:hypothetical protein
MLFIMGAANSWVINMAKRQLLFCIVGVKLSITSGTTPGYAD